MAFLDHEAIYKAYPNVTLIDDEDGAKDKDGNVVNLEDSTVAAARTQLDEDAAKVKYKSDRASSYSSIGEQLDMQYWDSVNGTTIWKDHVAKVKADNPKPS
tara:strand:- start:260 stop:562 length:303 start_codon:yes stop_codon:yes gene_type:complete